MYFPLEEVTLKDGDYAQAAVVVAPDEAWRARVETLLAHKPELWRWQIGQLLDGETSVEARFYFLQRDDTPFCHILTVEHRGVGLLGHVWTQPHARGQGAASQLMRVIVEDFARRGGRALFLSTEFDSAAFHIYRKSGFESVEPHSGVMEFFTASRAQFQQEYFAPGEAQIEDFNWRHYATASALLTGDGDGAIRCAPLGIVSRSLSESPFLPVLRAGGNAPRALALVKDNGATIGVAAWSFDALWPETIVADVWCHANFWQSAPQLLERLEVPDARRTIAYCDSDAKRAVLERFGFGATAVLPQWIASDAAQTGCNDATLLVMNR